MRTIQGVFLTLALFVSGSVATAGSATEEEHIMDLEARWSKLFGERNLEAVMGLMATNPVIIMPGSAPIVGMDEVRAATQAMMESDGKVSWESDFASVSSSGDMAFDYGTATTVQADGSVVQGYYLVVWKKENGKWKVAADMFN